MHRFAPALRRVARELDLPRGARATVLRELAGDLDAVYAHHRERGLGEAEAQRRAEETVLGTTQVIRRLARLHRRSWRGWSESMAARLTVGADLVMLVLGVVPVLVAGVFAARTAGGPLAWIEWVVGGVIGVTIATGVLRTARGQKLSQEFLETLLVCAALAIGVGLLTAAYGLHAAFSAIAAGGRATPLLEPARLARDGSVLVQGLLFGLAALFAWFLLLGRETARLSAEVDALLGPEESGPARDADVIPLTHGRSA